MMTFFETSEVKDRLSSLVIALQALGRAAHPSSKAAAEAHQAARIFIENGELFDRYCQHSIIRYGQILQQLRVDLGDPEKLNVQLCIAFFYTFVAELDLSTSGEIREELRAFKYYVESNSSVFEQKAKTLIEMAQVGLPVALMKQILNDARVGDLRSVPDIAQRVSDQVAGWKIDLDEKLKTVEDLRQTLTEQRDHFNFVGLFSGFNDLSIAKKGELKNARIMMWILGLLMTVPLFIDAIFLYAHVDKLDTISPMLLGAFSLLTFSVTFIFGYFYRIFLKSSQTCKAQLLQIEFRKTLCQFIQPYVSYASELKNKEALAKFESIVFSPLSFSEESNVSMFEGLEQLTGLVAAVRRKDSD